MECILAIGPLNESLHLEVLSALSSLFVNRIKNRYSLITQIIRVSIYERLLLTDSSYLSNFVRFISHRQAL